MNNSPTRNRRRRSSTLRNILPRNVISGGSGSTTSTPAQNPGVPSTSNKMYILPGANPPNIMVTGRAGRGKSITPGIYTQRVEDIETPRNLDPSAFLWGSKDHREECGLHLGTLNYNGEYGAIIPPAVGVDIWMLCGAILLNQTPLNQALLEDLIAMPTALSKGILEQARLDALSASSISTGKSLGPVRGDYLDAFTTVVSSMPLGTFPSTERAVKELRREDGGTNLGSPHSQLSNLWPGMPLGESMSPKLLGDEVQRHLRSELAGWMIQSHYQPMSTSYTQEERERFLREHRRDAARCYVGNLRVVTRQLSNLAEIANLPFNQEKGTWSTYLDNRTDPEEWRRAGYSTVEEISAMAKGLHRFLVLCDEEGQRDENIFLSLYMAQEHLSLPRLLDFAALTEEYNLEWALASYDWEE